MAISPATQAKLTQAVTDAQAASDADVAHDADVTAVTNAQAAEAASNTADLLAHQTALTSFKDAVNSLAADLGEPAPFPPTP